MRYTTLCYLENPAGEYLMLHRVKKENDCNRDKWIGIGGKFLDGESPEECALREINEETGLTVTGYRYRGIVTFVSDRWETEYMHLFTATEWTGRVREDCDEGVLEWIHKDRLAALSRFEFCLSFQINISCCEESFVNVCVHRADRNIQFRVICKDLIRGLPLLN